MPYLNIVADYPPGSRQPAWATLLRNGNYQLFIGPDRVRLFLKGEDPTNLLDVYHSVVRHPLRTVLEGTGKERLPVEVYAFKNDYLTRTISLDINPEIVDLGAGQLTARAPALPLASIADFFARGISLQAIEMGDKGDFYLYGVLTLGETIAGEQQSIEDFSVVYRSVFHHGGNPPYISLD